MLAAELPEFPDVALGDLPRRSFLRFRLANQQSWLYGMLWDIIPADRETTGGNLDVAFVPDFMVILIPTDSETKALVNGGEYAAYYLSHLRDISMPTVIIPAISTPEDKFRSLASKLEGEINAVPTEG